MYKPFKAATTEGVGKTVKLGQVNVTVDDSVMMVSVVVVVVSVVVRVRVFELVNVNVSVKVNDKVV